jgi:protease-4
MSEEQRAILQGMIDQFYGEFIKVVARGRGMGEERVRGLAG